MHSKIAMSPFASMLPHLCENDNNFQIKLRISDVTCAPNSNSVRFKVFLDNGPTTAADSGSEVLMLETETPGNKSC